MSARSSLSDASADNDEFLSAAFDELEAEEQAVLVRGDFLRDSDASSPSSAAQSAAGARAGAGGGARRSNAARMLEALEALSHEADAEGAGVPQSLRGLLEQLQGDGSGLGGLFPFSQLLGGGAGGTRFQRLLPQLAADQPVHAQMEALSELCETLSMSSEEALAVSGFSVDAFVPAVVTLIRVPSSMDVLLLAARALSTILELFPGAGVTKAAAERVIPSLCEKLLEIEYMDVAELALQILERIVCKAEVALSSSSSSSSPAQLCAQFRLEVIQENGLVALLQFVDFFPLEIQRRAARIVCQLCTDFPLSMEGKLRQGLPYMTNLLRSFDNEILQSSFAGLQKLGESTAFSENADFASVVATDEICGLLLNKLTSYASLEGSAGGSASSQLSPTGYTSMLRFLSCLLSCVPSDMSAASVLSSASHLRFVKLPPIVTALLAKPEVISENQLLRETLKLIIVVLPIAEELTSTDVIPPEMLALAHGILPLITRVYDVTSRTDLRYDCLGVIFRSCSLVHASQQPFTAQERTELSRLAAFLARVLRPKRNGSTATSVSALVKAEKDFVPAQLALRIIEVPLLHAGAQEAAKDIFERHGVASIIRFYASSPKQDDAAETDLQEIQTTSARLVREYFGDDSSIVSVMAQLENLVDELQTTLTSNSTTETDQPSSLFNALLKLRDFVAQGDDFLTAHEIACSGLVKVLIQILSTDQGQQDFAQMLEAQGDESDGSGFVASLLRCLQDAISSEKDVLSVSATDATLADMGLSSGSAATDLDLLTQHIKIHVLIEETKAAAEPDNEDQSTQQVDSREELESEENPLRWMKKTSTKRNGSNYKSNKSTVHDTVVLVEPLARIETMEDFIADKLFGRGGNAESIIDEITGAGAESEEGGEDESGEFANDVVKPRRVVATYKEQILPPDMSILEAIVKFGGLKADGKVNAERTDSATATSSSSRSRIWTSASHDVMFRVAASSSEDAVGWESAGDDTKIEAAFTATSDAAVSVVTGQWWDDVWDLLLLLKLVRKQCVGKSFGAPLNFVNSYLSLQVRRALQQPVRVVTNSLPEWCFRLVNEFAFVLEFETRCHFMYATTCGCSRAIQYLCRSVWRKAVMEEPAPVQQTRPSTSSGRRRYRDGSSRSRTSGLDNISQMVKLPRLKVRVARSRLLQSAMKLVAIYGGKKAVIEIEFLGEVGTGLGPTTEFFTLVCQQIQSKQLQLWRDDDRAGAASDSTDTEQKREAVGDDVDTSKATQAKNSLAIRGYHRVAVYHCSKCKALHIPSCSVHHQLLTHEKKVADRERSDSDAIEAKAKSGCSSKSARRKVSRNSVPQCAQCLDDHDWHSAAASCECKPSSDVESKPEDSDSKTKTSAGCTLKWWILSDEEVQYLAKVFPRHTKKVNHPVLQCAHCDTVNFPGTDAGIVVMDGDRMVSRSGRRMFERDYRAVTKHVSPLCEGTPLTVMTSAITRSDVDMLVEKLAQSPEVLESEVESLNYLSEAALSGGNVGGGPPVTAPFGLYPKPYLNDLALDDAKLSESSETSSLEADASSLSGDEVDVLTWFRFLGRFVGQAILDERLLNLPFARPFLRALRGEKLVGSGVSVEKSLSFVEELDPAVANSLRYLHDLASKYEASSESAEVAAWTEEVDSLCLSFTMVGADEIPLEAGGEDVCVTLDSLRRYVTLNLEFLLDRTIKSQVQAFRQGFEQICGQLFVFLQAFEVRELEALLSDRGTGSSMWDRDGVDLREHMVCDHGYTADSRAIAHLVSILCELTVDEQRLFVRFVTGANRLPLGGLRRLEPKLTVVRKLTEAGGASDENDAVLPSASTCTNYLKLPDYSTREVMKQRLLFCIHEGQCSFHLS
ncbi:hypothetical protein PR003_g19475 [Phytophthora rubi]|uniref:HECT-type E3 ubiquitin transferase n=1 Tax=Phytophthora rubi TaxID=129364 RepID=A0A6A3JTL5_9STRA|nr:hypothetical protein PR002_g18675 [Phytophthora rubi]KAE9313527.1 hypothetical protein PR003_g19475 [Phytophthora rubi]